jgi:hypothetical protein
MQSPPQDQENANEGEFVRPVAPGISGEPAPGLKAAKMVMEVPAYTGGKAASHYTGQ